jgi:hypothetical protein
VLWCLSVDDCTDRVLHLLATRSARETLGLNCEIKIRGPSLSRLHSGWLRLPCFGRESLRTHHSDWLSDVTTLGVRKGEKIQGWI